MFEVALLHPERAKGHNHLMMAGFPRLTLATRVLLGAMVFIILVAAVAIHLIVDTGRRTCLADRGTANPMSCTLAVFLQGCSDQCYQVWYTTRLIMPRP